MGRLITVFLVIAGLVVLADRFVFANYRSEIAMARARVATGAKVVRTPCGPIQYAVAGDGAPLLVIHGAGGGFDQGLDFVEPLIRSGFRVIAVSRFGYLGTPLPADASAPAQARAHACLLDALGIRSAGVFGGSAGAPSAMQFAILFPERTSHLVLLVPAAFVPRPDGAPPMKTPSGVQVLFDTALRSDFLFWAAIQVARSTVTRSILGTPTEVVDRASAEERARVDRVMAHILPVEPRRLGLLNDAAVVSRLPRYELEQIAAPTLVISAADDGYGTLEGARYTAQRIPGARLVEYRSGGHLLVGHNEEAAAEIAAFLR